MTLPVSVIIPCYLNSGTIDRAVRSVLAQSVLPFELLLIDDASPDGGTTIKKLNSIKQTNGHLLRIEVIPLEKNLGPSGARNAGWESATQPYIAFLDADDSWHPKKLEIQFGFMAAHPNIVMTGHQCVWLRPGDKERELPEEWDAHSVSRSLLLLSNRFLTPSVMLLRSIPLRFRDDMTCCEDYFLWMSIVHNGYQAWRIELPLAYLHKAPFGEAGLSKSNWELAKGQAEVCRTFSSPPTRPFIMSTIGIKFLRRVFISYYRRVVTGSSVALRI